MAGGGAVHLNINRIYVLSSGNNEIFLKTVHFSINEKICIQMMHYFNAITIPERNERPSIDVCSRSFF
jgi:hypothetical protein